MWVVSKWATIRWSTPASSASLPLLQESLRLHSCYPWDMCWKISLMSLRNRRFFCEFFKTSNDIILKRMLKLEGKFFWNICHQLYLGCYEKYWGLHAWPKATFRAPFTSCFDKYKRVIDEWDIPEKQHFRDLGNLLLKEEAENRSAWYDFWLSTTFVYSGEIQGILFPPKKEQDKQVEEVSRSHVVGFISVVCVLGRQGVGVKSTSVQLPRGTGHWLSAF